ncbi:MAG TPA: GNAT family N-acetyltransferase [Vineibacter sp.]|nr:GNAT family N-acetyltransferase [Vineibacter sp.]
MQLADRRIAHDDVPGVALRALTLGDLALMARWLGRPHLGANWASPQAALVDIAGQIDARDAWPFVIVGAGRPIGFVRIYIASGHPFWAGHDLPRETCGVDLFIGEPEALRRGHGSACLKLAASHLLALDGVARVHADLRPDNAAALGAYAKAGFARRGKIETPDGPAIYVTIERT